MEENFIYDDLVSHGDLGAIIHDLQTRKNELELHVASLEEDIKKLCDKITEMKAVQDNLSRNISELFNTARNELNRKDRRIAELQKQLDDLIFKRNTTPSNLGIKRKRELFDLEESNKKSKNETAGINPVHTESDDSNMNSKTKKIAHKEGAGLIDREHNSRYLPRKDSEPTGKTPYSRENSDRREARAQKEGDSHTTINERLNPDPSSQDSSKQESDRSRKASYSKENSYKRDRSAHKEDPHRSSIERSNQNSRDSSKHESDRYGKSIRSRDSSNRRDRRDDNRDKRDSYKDTSSLKDNRVDNRGGQRNYRDQKHRNRSYRDSNEPCRNNDYRNSNRDHRDSYEYRGNKNTHPEDARHTSDSYRNKANESRNLKGDKIDDLNHFGDQQMDRESRREPVLSVAESTERPSESVLDKVDTLDHSREDGELSDEGMPQVSKVAKKRMDFGKNLPFDEKKSFSVHKFVEKQKGMLKKEENVGSQNEKNNTQIEKSESQDTKTQNNKDKRMEVQKKDPVAEKKRVEIVPSNKICGNLKPVKNIELKVDSSKLCTKQNPNKNEEPKEEISKLSPTEDSSQNIESIQEKNKIYNKEKAVNEKELMDEIRQLSCVENPTKNEESNENCDTENYNTNVNIISQVILHEGMKEASADSSKSRQKDHNKCQDNKDKDTSQIILPKLIKSKRESRVPRNLTDELNINSERSDKMKRCMTQLFGSPETKPMKPFEQFSPSLSIGLSDDGEIPDLELLSSRDPVDSKTNSQASDLTTASNPVTEFQIFKSNLPSLEKTNSLSNIVVQIQTPDNSTTSKEPMKKSISAISDDMKESSKRKGISDEFAAKQGPLSTQGTVENVIQSSTDVCNVSLDLLNMDIGQCKAEDFPNLIVHSDSKDMSDLLLTPVNSALTASKKAARTQRILGSSAKIPSDENKLEPNNQIPAIKKEMERQHTDKCISNEKVADVPKQSSDISIKEKKQNVTKTSVPKSEKIVSAKNVTKSPRKYTHKTKTGNKLKTDSNIKIVDPIIANENICNDPQELKNGRSSEQETKVNTDTKDNHNEITKTPKDCTTSSKNQKQNMTNVDEKTVSKSIAELSENPVDTSDKNTNVNKEHSENAVVSLDVTKTINSSCKKRRRCTVKWV